MKPAPRKVACAILIAACGRFVLQQRDAVPEIIFPGLVSLFGGHHEAGETAWDCIQRELAEEIGITFSQTQLEPFLQFRTTFVSEHEPDLDVAIFFAEGVPADALRVTEGSLLLVTPADLARHGPRMTPLTSYAIAEFLHGPRLPAKMQQASRRLHLLSAAPGQAEQ